MQIVKQSLVGDYYIPSADVIIVCDVMRSTATQTAALTAGVERLYLFDNEIEYIKNRKLVGVQYPVFSFVEQYPDNFETSEEVKYKTAKSYTDAITKNEPIIKYNISPTFVASDEFKSEKYASFYGNWQTNILLSSFEAAKTVIAGGLINADAVIEHVKSLKPSKVVLIVVGDPEFEKIAPHNELLADYFQKALEDESLEKDVFMNEMRETLTFLLEGVADEVLEDIEYCLQLDKMIAIPILKKETIKKTDLIYLTTAK